MTSPRPACRILHLRASGATANTEGHAPEYKSSIATGTLEDKMSDPRAVREFADWAFGAEGLPDLQVLAWGDFSHEGRYARHNVLLCRADCGWRYLTKAQTTCWDLVADNMDMLSGRRENREP
jgi:hypothetical protein